MRLLRKIFFSVAIFIISILLLSPAFMAVEPEPSDLLDIDFASEFIESTEDENEEYDLFEIDDFPEIESFFDDDELSFLEEDEIAGELDEESMDTAVIADALIEEEGTEEDDSDPEIIKTTDACIELEDPMSVPETTFVSSNGLKSLYMMGSGSSFDPKYGDQLSGFAYDVYTERIMAYKNGNVSKAAITFTPSSSPYTFNASLSEDYTIRLDAEEYLSFKEQITKDMQAAVDAVCYDEPEIFWTRSWQYTMTTSAYKDSSSPTGYTGYVQEIVYIPQEVYPGSSARVSEFNLYVADAVAYISSPDVSDINGDGYVSDYEYILAAHDYICDRSYYDHERLNAYNAALQNYRAAQASDPEIKKADYINDYLIFSAGSVFIPSYGPGTVCEGYSRAFKILCDKREIPCVLVAGVCYGEGHMWNAVCLDDTWYMTDLTFDDSGKEISYNCFMSKRSMNNRITSGDFSGTGSMVFKYPVMSTVALNDLSLAAHEIAGDVVYTGSQVIPNMVLTGRNGLALTSGTDFDISFSNNVDAGTASFKAAGKGMYLGTYSGSFKISAANIDDASVTGVRSYRYTGDEITPSPSLTYNSNKLKKDVDYSIDYSRNINAGTGTIEISGMNNFSGSMNISFPILPASVSECVVSELEDEVYNGQEHVPQPIVSYKNDVLQGDSYSIVYSDNINAGTATVTISGRDNFSGSIKRTFKINPYELSGDMGNVGSYVYTGSQIIPVINMFFNSKYLQPDTDFEISGIGTNVGRYDIVVLGRGNYSGEMSANYVIRKRPLSDLHASYEDSYIYSGRSITPAVSLSLNGTQALDGKDYTAYYTNNIRPGTGNILLKSNIDSNYTGQILLPFSISKRSIAGASCVAIPDQIYTGKPHVPAVTLNYESEFLVQGKDFTVSYSDNTDVGTATITIKGISVYEGSKNVTFKIKKAETENGSLKPLQVKIGTTFTVGQIVYKVTGKRTVSVLKATSKNKLKTAIIPSSVKYNEGTFSVTGIYNSAFKNCTNLSKVKIPDSVKTIGANAFYGCYKLRSVSIPNSVNTIGKNAFRGCKRVSKITIGSGVRKIGSRAFAQCGKINQLFIKNKIITKQSLGSNVFKKTSAYSLTMPRGKKTSYLKLLEKCGLRFSSWSIRHISYVFM